MSGNMAKSMCRRLLAPWGMQPPFKAAPMKGRGVAALRAHLAVVAKVLYTHHTGSTVIFPGTGKFQHAQGNPHNAQLPPRHLQRRRKSCVRFPVPLCGPAGGA